MSVEALPTMRGGLLYGRVYSVALQGPDGRGPVYGNEKPGMAALRVAFEIERDVPGAAKGKVAIFNLSPASRNALKVNMPVQLRAGYINQVGTLMTGQVSQVTVQRDGPDIVTELDLTDAEPFTHMSTFDRHYAPGARLTTILGDVAGAMSTTLLTGTVKAAHGIAIGIPERQYSGGFVAHGPCKHTLDKLCRPQGLEWAVSNGALLVIPKGHYDGRLLQVLSRESGLIGVPGVSTDCTTFQSLMLPTFSPGGLVELRSINKAVNGIYKLRKVAFRGDSHGPDWQAALEGVPYTGSLVPLPVSVGGSYATAAVT